MISLLFHAPYKSLHIDDTHDLLRVDLDNNFTPGHWNPSNQLACVCKSGYRLEAICVVSRAHVQHTYYTSPYI